LLQIKANILAPFIYKNAYGFMSRGSE